MKKGIDLNRKFIPYLGVDRVKTAALQLSSRISAISSSASKTPRTMYASLPTNDFDSFVNDDNPEQGKPDISGIYQSPTSISLPHDRFENKAEK
jgi:hypothetical protein